MSLDPKCVGATSAEYRLSYDWKTLVLYALGIGAKRSELDYLYEARGPKAFPTFGVVPTYPVLDELLSRSGGRLERVVHNAQSLRIFGELPPEGELTTRGEITGLYDLKRMAQLTFRTRSSLEGRLIFETDWSLVLLGDGGFDGPRPPKTTFPKIETDAAPVFSFEEPISSEQALLYRLSGDLNPLHVDPAVASSLGFERGPILHGLATFGYAARALVQSVLGGDARRLLAFHAQFRKPVWPGDTLRTVGFEVDGQYALRAFSGPSDELVALFAAEVAKAG